MSHEFVLHHHVSELMQHLGLPPTAGPGAEVFTSMLEKSITPFITTQISVHSAKKKITDTVVQSQAFIAKYDELKSKNIKDLDVLVYLLSRLLDDSPVRVMLEKTKSSHSEGLSVIKPILPEHVNQSSSKLSSEELGKIRAEISKVASSNLKLPSDVLKKVSMKEKHPKQISIPSLPAWMHQRNHLSMDFCPDKDVDKMINDIGKMSIGQQEAFLVEDLLYCSEGIEGRYIYAEPLSNPTEERKLSVDPNIDSSLKKMVLRILPMCSMYSGIIRFIEEKCNFKHGLVNQALVAAMRSLMKEYMLLIAKLEHQQRLGKLSLQKFWFYIQPTMQTMGVLSSIVTSINKRNCRGGAVLTLLHEKTSSLLGDKKGQQLCFCLTQAACVPYFEILEKWIYKGVISDPYFEFMVDEDDAFQKEKLGEDFNDAYWEQKYTLQKENIPVFLEKVANKILDTGKYLNVIRQCGRDVSCPSAETLEYTSVEREFVDKIGNAFQYASSLLLNMLIKEMGLMARLRSIKHYFLLDQGDFIVQFMDMAKHEMKKPMEEILLPRLETLLELALRTSTANIDPYKDDLKVDLLPYDLVSQLFKILTIETKQEKDYRIDPTDLRLSGLESFAFDYVVRWPVSLVLNRKALTKYQILSRHLFYSKYVERQLCNVWVRDKASKVLISSVTLGSRAYALRQRMLNFVQNFEYYVMLEVIEPHWQLFESNMASVTNVDEVLSYHTDFLNNCLKDSMLTTPSLLKILHELMMTCIMFSNSMQKLNRGFKSSARVIQHHSFTSSITDSEKKKALEALSEHLDDVIHTESYEQSIATTEARFSKYLVDLLDKIVEFSVKNCEHKLMNIIHRLDFNGFYRNKLEKLTSEKVAPVSSKMPDGPKKNCT